MSLIFLQGFTAEIIDVLQRRYPADTLVNLQTSSYKSLTDIQGAFPDDTILPSGNLKKFVTVSIPYIFVCLKTVLLSHDKPAVDIAH